MARRGTVWRGEARQAWRGAVMQARQNGDGERPVAARKDGLHLNNDERHERESEE